MASGENEPRAKVSNASTILGINSSMRFERITELALEESKILRSESF